MTTLGSGYASANPLVVLILAPVFLIALCAFLYWPTSRGPGRKRSPPPAPEPAEPPANPFGSP